LSITAPTASALSAIRVELRHQTTFFDSAVLAPDRATIAMLGYDEAPISIHVVGEHATTPAADVPYTIELRPLSPDRCPEVAATYSEADDTATSTGNDALRVSFTSDDGYQATQTAAADAPEPTGLTLGTTAGFDGVAGINPTHGDLYQDRDAYLITTGPSTRTLDLRLTWDNGPGPGDDADLDIMVFPVPAGSDPSAAVPRLGGANTTGVAGPELAVTTVEPSTMYWVLVANAADASVTKSYRVTLCGS
jgi:hypothetical protein